MSVPALLGGPPDGSPPAATASPSDNLTLTVGSSALAGWTEVKVSGGLETCPRSFDLQMTEQFPGQTSAFLVQPGDECTIEIGGDLVVSGYVDRVNVHYEPGAHSIRVSGRGKCQDLVDCSAEWPGGQISATSALDLAQKLAEPYKITVIALGSPKMPVIPQFNLSLGETAYDIIERVCRYSGLLCYEDAKGRLVLATAQTTKAASGFVEGANILVGDVIYSSDQRFSEYDCFLLSTDVLGDFGQGGNLLATSTDPGVKRPRKTFIIADAGSGGMQIAQARANWEANRRWGRANVLSLTVDSWRDSAGTLWTPNTLAQVDAPNLHWSPTDAWPLLGDFAFILDAQGTRTEIVLMPPQAFQPEPVLLQAAWPDIVPPSTGAANNTAPPI